MSRRVSNPQGSQLTTTPARLHDNTLIRGEKTMATRTGERKLQILQALADMLQDPKGEKVTTAALAARLEVSEAALYRHFASKAQMFEGLIEFIEQNLMSSVSPSPGEAGVGATGRIVALLLDFARQHPGLCRVLTGDALVNEDSRLQSRINQMLERLEGTLRSSLKGELGEEGAASGANLLLCFTLGRWQQFVKSGFTRDPAGAWSSQWALLQAGLSHSAASSAK